MRLIAIVVSVAQSERSDGSTPSNSSLVFGRRSRSWLMMAAMPVTVSSADQWRRPRLLAPIRMIATLGAMPLASPFSMRQSRCEVASPLKPRFHGVTIAVEMSPDWREIPPLGRPADFVVLSDRVAVENQGRVFRAQLPELLVVAILAPAKLHARDRRGSQHDTRVGRSTAQQQSDKAEAEEVAHGQVHRDSWAALL